MLLDHIDVVFSAGHGGAGKVSFKRLGKGPDGGNGGKGGDLYVTCTSDLSLLNQFSRKAEVSAEDGVPGMFNMATGRKGEDIEVKLPIGTSLIDRSTNKVVLELTEIGQKVLLLKGGIGGKGNFDLRSAKNTSPQMALR
jgi:GTP-binding protein